MGKLLLIIIVVLIAVLLLAWAPWITEEYVINKIVKDPAFIESHKQDWGTESVSPAAIYVNWFPFGRLVSTYEGAWFVTFCGNVV